MEKLILSKMNECQDIRNRIRAARRRLEPLFVSAASAAAQRRAVELAEWRRAQNICCYLAMPLETQTETIVAQCHALKKQLFVPAFQDALRKYVPALLGPDDEVALGKYNVLEPVKPRWSGARKIDLVFVPGLAFDRQGGRLGHGGGHYDRLLVQEALRPACKVGLAFDFQMFARLPLRADDVRMDIIITESAVFRCRQGSASEDF